jgi:hypothetical protein
MNLDHVADLHDIIALHHLAIVDGPTPDACELELGLKILMDPASRTLFRCGWDH